MLLVVGCWYVIYVGSTTVYYTPVYYSAQLCTRMLNIMLILIFIKIIIGIELALLYTVAPVRIKIIVNYTCTGSILI